MLKRARFGLEKLRALCERVLRREKDKRREAALHGAWAMQARAGWTTVATRGDGAEPAAEPEPGQGVDDGQDVGGRGAAPPEGYAFEREDTGA